MKPPKSYKQIMDSMLKDVIATTSVEDLATGSAIRELMKAMEMDMYSGWPKHERGVRELLGKLGVKSAREHGPGLFGGKALQIESLDSVLKQVTYDSGELKRWKTDGGK